MAVPSGYDFSGYATKYNVLCSDGRTILPGAFDDQEERVPLVDMHNHKSIEAVIGHALLEHRQDGLYAYCYLNHDTPGGQYAKALISHGDIDSMSIWANELKQHRGKVSHGRIKELSLVMAGANKGAKIDFYEPNLSHDGFGIDEDAEDAFDSVIVHSGLALEIPDYEEEDTFEEGKDMNNEELMHAEISDDDTILDAYNKLDEKTRMIVDYIVGAVAGEEGEEEMAHGGFNLFEDEYVGNEYGVLSHDDLQACMDAVWQDMKRGSLMRDALIEHAAEYGIENIDILFPEASSINPDGTPEWVNRDQEWVQVVMAGVHKFPFARVRMDFADITPDEARAKGYIKGKFKQAEVFSLLKRSVTPTTVYKKQKLDRDDVIDISKNFDVIPWLKSEMRLKLNEELARAYVFGDGRLSSSNDKIDESKIIPVINDHDFFVLRYGISETVNTPAFANAFIDGAVKSKIGYKGSGNAVMLTSEDTLTEMILLKDADGRRLYKNEEELAAAMRVSGIVTVPYLSEGVKDKDGKDVYAVILNLDDYGVGTDKGGEVNTFDDFDIDYNQYKYLMESRCSGALRKPFSAIVIRKADTTGSQAPGIAAAITSSGMKPANE